MTIETTAAPYAVIWSTNAVDPCLTQWKRNKLRARWQAWQRFDTAGEAREVAHANGLIQFIPAKQEEEHA